MKTFRYKLGHVAGHTLTVAELRELLERYPDDMPVLAEWEGTFPFIHPDNFRVEAHNKGTETDTCDCLIIDVNGY